MIIRNREKNFIRFIEKHFGISIPSAVQIFYAKGIRIGNHDIMKSTIHGELGYAASDFGFNPTNAFIQNFGHLASKNIFDTSDEQAKFFASGKGIPADLGKTKKYLVVRYGKHTLGLGFYEPGQKKIICKIPEKRRREIV